MTLNIALLQLAACGNDQQANLEKGERFFQWLKAFYPRVNRICSVCVGAYALAEAGILDGKQATTHWEYSQQFQQRYPLVKVDTNPFFTRDTNIYTSGGVSSGIDLALAILEELKGPLFTHKVARGLVVYHRRSEDHTQESIYLDYRNHISPNIHKVQDHLIEHLSEDNSIEDLASLVAMSPRNLSRVFKEKTGTTVLEYLTLLRLEFANTMLNNPEFTIEYIASKCGFKTARQLQRILKANRKGKIKES